MTTDADKGGRAHASLIGSVTALKLFEDGDQQYVQIKMRTAGAEVVVVARRAVFGSQFDRLGLGAGIEVLRAQAQAGGNPRERLPNGRPATRRRDRSLNPTAGNVAASLTPPRRRLPSSPQAVGGVHRGVHRRPERRVIVPHESTQNTAIQAPKPPTTTRNG